MPVDRDLSYTYKSSGDTTEKRIFTSTINKIISLKDMSQKKMLSDLDVIFIRVIVIQKMNQQGCILVFLLFFSSIF